MRTLTAKSLGQSKMGGDPSHAISLSPLSPYERAGKILETLIKTCLMYPRHLQISECFAHNRLSSREHG